VKTVVFTGFAICRKQKRICVSPTIIITENTSKSMTEIASESGFETIRTFNRAFNQHFGTSPAQYRKNKADFSSH